MTDTQRSKLEKFIQACLATILGSVVIVALLGVYAIADAILP